MDELLEKLGYHNFVQSVDEGWYPTTMIIRKLEDKRESPKVFGELIGSNTRTIRVRNRPSNIITVNTGAVGLSNSDDYVEYTWPLKKDVTTQLSSIVCLRNDNLKLVIYKKTSEEGKPNSFTFDKIINQQFSKGPIKNEELLKAFTFVKINNFELSSSLFGHTATKKQMFESNQLYNINKLYPNYECKDGVFRNILEIQSPIGKNLKFILDELELIYVNVDKLTKGFNKPLDRTIRKESKVKVYKKNNANLAYGTLARVVSLPSAGNIRYAKIVTEDKKEYMIQKNKIKVIA